MSKPGAGQFRNFVKGKELDYTFVETGCENGETLNEAAKVFGILYSIELDWDRYWHCVTMFWASGVQIIHGDSAVILPKLINEIEGPICYWLDAHSAPGVKSVWVVPLLAELRAIVARDNHRDVICIDDTRAFGTGGEGDDWSEITNEVVEEILTGYNLVKYNDCMETGHWYRSGVMIAHKL